MRKYDDDWFLLCFYASMGLMIGGFIGFIFALAIIPSDTKQVITTNNLIALKDTSTLQGSFFLGTGSIDGEMKYTFYYETDNGFKLRQLSNYRVTIKYDGHPRIETITKVKTDAFINHFSLFCGKIPEYIIYVPENTISNNFNLDLE